MLAPFPACSLNQIPTDLGIPSDSTNSKKQQKSLAQRWRVSYCCVICVGTASPAVNLCAL